MNIEHVAEICHEAHKAFCNTMADAQMMPWAITRPEVKAEYVQAVTFMAGQPASWTPRQAHEKWVRKKTAAGWRYGPVENATTLEHPGLLPYDGLEPRQQFAHELLKAIVDASRPYLQTCPSARLAAASSRAVPPILEAQRTAKTV